MDSLKLWHSTARSITYHMAHSGGMTLLSPTDRSIPYWRLGSHLIKESLVTFLTGVDGTGNMYNVNNLDDCVTRVGKVNVVTGDGGFDFSNNFNEQETMCLPLVCAEVHVALRVQERHGSFILKIFDVFSEETMKVLHILTQDYTKVHICKPASSRPANSEKYVVCTDFQPSEFITEHVDALRSRISGDTLALGTVPLPRKLVKVIAEFNKTFVSGQISNIKKTIDMI